MQTQEKARGSPPVYHSRHTGPSGWCTKASSTWPGGGVEFHPPLHMLVLRVLFYFTSLFQNLLPQFRFGKYLVWHSLITCQGLSVLLTSTWNMSHFGPEELSASFVRTLHAGGSWRTVWMDVIERQRWQGQSSVALGSWRRLLRGGGAGVGSIAT